MMSAKRVSENPFETVAPHRQSNIFFTEYKTYSGFSRPSRRC